MKKYYHGYAGSCPGLGIAHLRSAAHMVQYPQVVGSLKQWRQKVAAKTVWWMSCCEDAWCPKYARNKRKGCESHHAR